MKGEGGKAFHAQAALHTFAISSNIRASFGTTQPD
jgi:hypothetical protein